MSKRDNSRLPIVYLNRVSDDTILGKLVKPDTTKGIALTGDIFKTNKFTKYYNTRSKEEYRNKIQDEEFSNIEYTKSVIKALNEALNENEKVSYIISIILG